MSAVRHLGFFKIQFSSVVWFKVSLCHFAISDCGSFNCCGEMASFKFLKWWSSAILKLGIERVQACTR